MAPHSPQGPHCCVSLHRLGRTLRGPKAARKRAFAVIEIIKFTAEHAPPSATSGYATAGPDALVGNTTLHDSTMCKDDTGKYFVFCASI